MILFYMTVGIALTNGLEAIIITDSRVSSGTGRESDSVKKMGEFYSENYTGVIFGTGRVNLVLGIIKNLNFVSAESIDGYVLALHDLHKNNAGKIEDLSLKASKAIIVKKSGLIDNEEERNHYIRKKTSELIDHFERTKEEEGYVAVVAYDKQKEKIRLFIVNSHSVQEQFSDHLEIGSGNDGANLYLANKLQGVDTSRLKINDLTFFALNAYASSTINSGVGGTPIIALVSVKGCDVLSDKKINTLGNISGAYLSEYPGSGLDLDTTRRIFGDVLNGANFKYSEIAKKIGLNTHTLKATYIPYKSWQETANRMTFAESTR
jgi:hypothetical protein